MVEENEVWLWLWSPMVVELWGVEEVNWQLSSPPPSVTGGYIQFSADLSFQMKNLIFASWLTIKRSYKLFFSSLKIQEDNISPSFKFCSSNMSKIVKVAC